MSLICQDSRYVAVICEIRGRAYSTVCSARVYAYGRHRLLASPTISIINSLWNILFPCDLLCLCTVILWALLTFTFWRVLIHPHKSTFSLVLDYLLHRPPEIIKVHLIWLLHFVLLNQLRILDPSSLVHWSKCLELWRIFHDSCWRYNFLTFFRVLLVVIVV